MNCSLGHVLMQFFTPEFDCFYQQDFLHYVEMRLSLTITTHDHCHVNKQRKLQGWYHKYKLRGLISSFSDVGGSTKVGSNKEKNSGIFLSRKDKTATPGLKV